MNESKLYISLDKCKSRQHVINQHVFTANFAERIREINVTSNKVSTSYNFSTSDFCNECQGVLQDQLD